MEFLSTIRRVSDTNCGAMTDHVEVTFLSGARLAMPMWFEGCIADVKETVETTYEIPCREQRMFHGCLELHDGYRIYPRQEILLHLVRRNPAQARWLERARLQPVWFVCMRVPLWVRDDREIMIAALKTRPDLLILCSARLQADRAFLREAASINGLVLAWIAT